MSTFNQNTHGANSTPIQNTGSMNLTVDHSQRSGDTISIGGNVGNIGSVGGSNIQNTINSGNTAKNRAASGTSKYHDIYYMQYSFRYSPVGLKYLIISVLIIILTSNWF